MSASEAGSSESMDNSSPGRMAWMASRDLTIGIGQKSPMQSISLSGMETLGSVAMPRYGILGLAAQSRRAGAFLDYPGPASQYLPDCSGQASGRNPVRRAHPGRGRRAAHHHARPLADLLYPAHGGRLQSLRVPPAAARPLAAGPRPALASGPARLHRPPDGGGRRAHLGPDARAP